MAVFNEAHEHMFTYFRLWSISKTDLERIQIGDSIDSVMEKDPNGDYIFLYTGHGEPWVSSHYTEDGYYILIEYDVKMTVTGVSVSLI